MELFFADGEAKYIFLVGPLYVLVLAPFVQFFLTTLSRQST